ncbi:MAG: type II secretion system F family protein [Tepidisphaeraceae bacterium]|jgi:type IV pilus assembly protein PilC
MPTFTFTARDASGKWHNGAQAADTPTALAGALRTRGLSLVNAAPSDAPATPAARKLRRGILPPTSLDIELGLRMLANMLQGGLTLLAGLKTCVEQSRRARMAAIWQDVHDRISAGLPFADALARHGNRFPQLVIQLVKAGEISGNLELVLEQAAEQLERKRNLLITLISALMYPAITTLLAVSVAAFLMIKIIPEISQFLVAQNRQLPAVTQALIVTSNFLNTYFMPISIVSATVIAGLFLLHRWPPAGLIMDTILLRIPIVGKLFRLAGTTMFARGLGMLLDAGVPVLTALETAGGLMRNRAIARRVEQARRSVLAGNTLAVPLAAGREFLPMLHRMVAVGEQSGTLTSVLRKVADFHEQQLQSFIKRMTLLIEPIMTIVVGSIVGFVYLAFFMAVYSTASG